MMLEMLPALSDGSEFEIVRFTVCKPQSPSLFDCLARAGGSVNALLNFMQGGHLPLLRLLLGDERLEPAVAVLVNVIDNPGLVFFVGPELPFANACHCLPPIWPCGVLR